MKNVILAFLLIMGTMTAFADEKKDSILDCSYVDNDLKAFLCAGTDQSFQFQNTGSQKVYYTYEKVFEYFTAAELDADYEYFILINSARVNDSNGSKGPIPAQSIAVLKKQDPNERMFNYELKRLSNTKYGLKFNGINYENMANFNDIFSYGHLTEGYGKPYKYTYKDETLTVIPTSTGISGSGSILTFSGIFQPNISRSRDRRSTYSEAPMSYQTYVGYRYDSGRQSGVAIHGTPSRNLSRLGRRASHGCARVHPSMAKQISSMINDSDDKLVKELDWDYGNGVIDSKTPEAVRKPVLIIIFNGYDSQGDLV